MSWLNWSLKLHIRLRTISLMISIHITQVLLNECHIYLCDCTWLNVFSHTQSLLIKHKKICDFLGVFGKYFVFTKIIKFSKTVLPCSGDSVVGWSSRMSQSRAYTEIFCDSLEGQCPSLEKYLEYFSKFGFFFVSRGLVWRLVCGWKVQSWEVYRDFRGLSRDLENFSNFCL